MVSRSPATRPAPSPRQRRFCNLWQCVRFYGLAFNLSFQLSGSANGWDVKLSGRLVGLLFAASPTNPSATVFAGAEILAGGPSFLLGPFTIAPDRQRDVDVNQMVHGFLSDGTYTVIGFLRTTASVDASFDPFASGGGRSDFASQGGQGFFGGDDATSVPEPSAFMLLGTGTLALAQVCRSTARKNASS
jgi:hypothetical protein